MGKNVTAVLGAILYLNVSSVSVSADTVALTLPAPIPSFETALPSLPNLDPVRLDGKAILPQDDKTSNLSGATAKQADISAFGFACVMHLNVTPMPRAILDVSIDAPCKPDQTIQIRLGGTMFETSLSMTGEARLQIPALEYQDEVAIEFEDQHVITKATQTPDLDGFVRVALSWDQPHPPVLNGKAPRHLPIDITTLGDGTGRTVQVLSHHVDPEAKAGVIRLGMTTTVTPQNCGGAQSGQILQHTPGYPQLRYNLTLVAAGCDRVGHNLELKNVLQDLKLAAS